jgi:F-type H+-transporting ATPase subunit a
MGATALGVKKYAGKFLISPLKKPYFIGTFVGLLEIISEFAKVISFSFRLFGNIFAGEVLLTVMLMLVPYFLPLPFLFLEIFVGFIQALVFAMLTLVFMKMATEAH